jgi:broad specificity phosphatase PhoE
MNTGKPTDESEDCGTRILLIRHGETNWNRIHRFHGRSDEPLSQKGREEAHALALALKDESLTAIYSSPLIRAKETALHIKAFHPTISLIEEKALIEMDFGVFEGMEAERWVEEYPNFCSVWLETPASVTMPGGESLTQVQARALDALERITALHPPGSTLLLCSHKFVNLTILCHAMGLPLDRFREIPQETAAINLLHKNGPTLSVKVVNERSRLSRIPENGDG